MAAAAVAIATAAATAAANEQVQLRELALRMLRERAPLCLRVFACARSVCVCVLNACACALDDARVRNGHLCSHGNDGGGSNGQKAAAGFVFDVDAARPLTSQCDVEHTIMTTSCGASYQAMRVSARAHAD